MAYLQESFYYPWITPLQNSRHLRSKEGSGKAFNKQTVTKQTKGETHTHTIRENTTSRSEHMLTPLSAQQMKNVGWAHTFYDISTSNAPSFQWHCLRKCLQKCCQPTGDAHPLFPMQVALYQDDQSMLCELI